MQVLRGVTNANLAADANDFAPGGLGHSDCLRVNPTVNASLTGLGRGQRDGQLLFLQNVSTLYSLTLKNESSSSRSGSRFVVSDGSDAVLSPGQTIFLIYDALASRWRAGATLMARRGNSTLLCTAQSVGSTATQIVAARNTRGVVTIKNLETSLTVYVGPTGVTIANGMELKAGESKDFGVTAAIFGIVSSGTAVVRASEEYD